MDNEPQKFFVKLLGFTSLWHILNDFLSNYGLLPFKGDADVGLDMRHRTN